MGEKKIQSRELNLLKDCISEFGASNYKENK